jgi:DNA-binding transcriptional MerR regulator
LEKRKEAAMCIIRMEKAAKRLKMHRLTLHRLEKRGKIPPIPRDRNGWRVFNRELIEDLKRRLHPELYPDQKKK